MQILKMIKYMQFLITLKLLNQLNQQSLINKLYHIILFNRIQMMLSTHIMQEVEAMCDRVIIINKGEIVANDQTQTLQKNTTKQLITVEFDKIVSLDTIMAIIGVEEAILIENNTWKIIAPVDSDVRKELFNFAVKNNIGVLTLNKEEQKLEDVFKALTKK